MGNEKATDHSGRLGSGEHPSAKHPDEDHCPRRVAFGFTDFANYHIRSVLNVGKPNWILLATVGPRRDPKYRKSTPGAIRAKGPPVTTRGTL